MAAAGCLAALLAVACALPAHGGAAEHHWPNARGHPGRYQLTNETMPFNLNDSFAWSFHHPEHRFATTMRGNPLIDSERNIVISTEQAIFKLDSNGQMLWAAPSPSRAPMNVVPSLLDGAVYGMAMDATVFALNLSTGMEIWRNRHAENIGGDTAYVDARDGILLASVDHSPNHDGGNMRVLGLNISQGSKLWEVTIDLPTWNFNPLFPGDGSVIFMDVSGGVHCLDHATGKRHWHARVPEQFNASFTDGGVSLSQDGKVAFACSNNANDTDGVLRAYRTGDGSLMWEKFLPTGCTSWPVIARTNDWGVLAAGHFVAPPLVTMLPPFMPQLFGALLHFFTLAMGASLRRLWPFSAFIRAVHTEIIAFDTATGATRWSYRTPDWQRLDAKGDGEGLADRVARGRSPICLPTSWGVPTLSGDDTVHVGHCSGLLYTVKDRNGDGRIDPETEVSTFDMDAAPLPNNPAWAPGMMAVASCDTLFVFKSTKG